MKTKRILSLLLITTFLVACGGQDGENELAGNQDAQYLDPSEDILEEDAVSIDRKLIKTAHVDFEVENMNSTEIRIRKAAYEHNGYITNEDQYDYDGRMSFSMEIKIPSANFTSMMGSIAEGVDEFDSRNVSVDDVTEEYIDVASRIKTKKEVEQRYVELLQQAYTVEEVLLIEAQLKILREEIESFEGRLKYLKQSVAYSTIHVTFYEKVRSSTHFGRQFADSFVNGWRGFVYFLVMLTQLWPFFVITAGILLFYKMRKKKKTSLNN